jgi:hypothetical protein
MLGIVVFAALVWIVVQASAKKHQLKWRGRFQAPLAQRVRGDARAIAQHVSAYRGYRRDKRRGWDNPEVF